MAGKSADRRKRTMAKNLKLAPVKTIKIEVIDYKDVATLRKFVSDRGKIRARRITGATVQDQRKITSSHRDSLLLGPRVARSRSPRYRLPGRPGPLPPRRRQRA